MTTELRRQQNHAQRYIHTHVHIQLHIHNHIFTMNLCNFITLLQPNFDINQSTKKNDILQTMTAYTKRDTNERKDANAQSIAHRFQTHRNSHIYLGEISLAYNARIWGAVSDWR